MTCFLTLFYFYVTIVLCEFIKYKEDVSMQKISQNGNRIYFFETVNAVPSINELILSDKCKTFIDSVTLNPKNVNAKLYSQFTKETYPVFLYAFAFQFGRLRFTSDLYTQFETNARRAEKLCKKKNIILSTKEAAILDKCKNFHLQQMHFNNQKAVSDRFLSDLAEVYL